PQIDDLLVGTDLEGAGVALDKFDEPGRVGEAVAAQRNDRALGPGYDPLKPGTASIALDRDDLEEVFDLRRQWPEAVDQLGGKAVDLAAAGERGDAAIEPEPYAEIGDIALRDQHR